MFVVPIVTDCAVSYVPAAGLKVGVATTGAPPASVIATFRPLLTYKTRAVKRGHMSGHSTTTAIPGGSTTYTVTVSSSDGGNTASLTLTVTLTNAVTPAATAGTGLTLSSGTTFTGSTADGTYVLNISATGGTGSGWTYAIVTQSSGFAISGGALTLTASTAGTYTATISATDGSSNTANITVTINLQ